MTHNIGRRNFWRLGLDVLALGALALGTIGLHGCGSSSGGGDSSNVRVNTVNPSIGPFIGGVQLTISGVGFVAADGSANVVTIGGRDCTNVVTVNDTTIECKSPIGTPGMRVDVVVRNTSGQGKLVNGFMYLALAAPRSDLSGDGIADLIVSAPSDDTAGTDAGAVYVFFGTDAAGGVPSVTSAQADVVIFGQGAGDNFGLSIRTGDVNGDDQDDLVVGADRWDSATVADAGAAYVFYGPMSGPAPISAVAANLKLWGDSGIAGDRFGSYVDVGDVDGDGKTDVLVSGVGTDGTGSKLDVGCAYVFKGGAQLVSQGAQSAAIKIFGDQTNDQAGASMGCGDLNADGIADVVIGVPLYDPRVPQALQNAGGALVFFGGQTLASGTIAQATAVFSGEAIEDQFGTSVVVTDVDNDGTQDLVVGAPMNDANDPDTGRVYVFLGGPGFVGERAQTADITLSGLPNQDSFGTSIGTGDINGDAIADLVIGAPLADYLNDRNGRAYVFLGGAMQDDVASSAFATFNGEAAVLDRFGSGLSATDSNDDGYVDLVTSSIYNTAGAGRIYVFHGGNMNGQNLAVHANTKLSGATTGGRLGTAIAPGQ
jgi:hypothetical protein